VRAPQLPDKLHAPPQTKGNRPSHSNLSRRGRKSRVAVTSAEIEFCAYFVLTGNVKQASLQAGYSAWWGYELVKLPRVQPILREFERRKKDEAWAAAKDENHTYPSILG
jgi:Terminase small subunit